MLVRSITILITADGFFKKAICFSCKFSSQPGRGPPLSPSSCQKEAIKLWLSQPYSLWVKAYVNGNKKSKFQKWKWELERPKLHLSWFQGCPSLPCFLLFLMWLTTLLFETSFIEVGFYSFPELSVLTNSHHVVIPSFCPLPPSSLLTFFFMAGYPWVP